MVFLDYRSSGSSAGLQQKALGPQRVAEKAHGVKREEGGTEETLLCSFMVARARAGAEPAG